MSASDDDFEKALLGKNIPILPLDNKWYRLMVGLEKTPEMTQWEEEIKELLKAQGKCNTDIKNFRKMKSQLMNEILGVMENADADQVQTENKEKIEEYNNLIDEYQEKLTTFPERINELNYQLMLATMRQCYDIIGENTAKIEELAQWLADIRVELKKNVVRKQEKELKNQEIYNYMHDIFGAEVIDIFDMKYNPGDKILKNGGN